MPQNARPDADTHIGNYTDQGGGVSNIFQAIDEAVASDADYIQSPANPVDEPYVCRLSDVADPLLSTGHVVRVRVSTNVASGGESIIFTIELRQGYVSEASQGTLIASGVSGAISGTGWTDLVLTLTGPEADAITNYNDLFIRIVADKV